MKKGMYFVLVTGMALSLMACGSSSYKDAGASDMATNESFDYNGFEEISEEGKVETSVNDGSTAESPSETGVSDYSQKLIKTYHYSFETIDFDSSIQFIEEKVKTYGGYIESSEQYGSSNRSAYINVRIPKDRADQFLSETGSIGEITYQSSSTEDITLNYYDLTAHLETLQAKRERLLVLLEQAVKLEDIVTLQGELSDCEYEINRLETQKRVYDNKVDYVTIDMDIAEVKQIQVVDEDDFLTRINKGLSKNTANVCNGLVDLFIGLIILIPYLVVLGVVAVIVILIIRAGKKRKNRKLQQEDKKDV